jgi:Ni/Co efflux regulator RcnB
MTHAMKINILMLATLVWAGASLAEEPDHGRMAAAPAAMHRGEPHPGPSGYQRVAEPKGWNTRPATVDRGAYQHNFQAARSYRIGPYHRPAGWVNRQWAYGDILPRSYWAAPFILADYWLFALEVPPAGYEWVRVGNDALLVSTANGEVLQVEYGVFA